MTGQTVAALMFPAMFVLIFLGVPVAFSLITVGFAGALMLFGSLTPLQNTQTSDAIIDAIEEQAKKSKKGQNSGQNANQNQ